MRSISNREYFQIKVKTKPNFWYTPTIEEQRKLIFYLKEFNDIKASRLLKAFVENENEFIKRIATNILNSKSHE
jgi:hypothetical protein